MCNRQMLEMDWDPDLRLPEGPYRHVSFKAVSGQLLADSGGSC